MIAYPTAPRTMIKDYAVLTKPPVVALLVFTALGGMFLASQGVPDAGLILAVLGGGAMAAGGANAINHYLDRDIDQLMRRTSQRPVVMGRIQPRNALAFGIALNVIAFAILALGANPLSAVLTLGATLFYVFVYTMALKRTTTQNIVIGGAAGAIPPLVGWTAVTGFMGLPGIYLFMIVFFWTPPHFWALSLLIKDDYARAKIPMLPVVVGVRETRKSIFLYTWLLGAMTLMFFATGVLGWLYLAAAILLIAAFLYYAWRLMKQPETEVKASKGVYLYSMLYLALLFVAIMIDSST